MALDRVPMGRAGIGSGLHRSDDVADARGVKVSSVAPTRNSLIAKGMLYSPGHGDTAFTVPLFNAFMRRLMPEAWPLWFYFKFLSMFLV